MTQDLEEFFGMFTQKSIISLVERTDRRRALEKEFVRFGLKPKDIGFEVFPAVRVAELNGFPSLGARGCFLSHLACLKQAIERGCDRVLILEDDVAFSSALPNSASCLSARLQRNDWSFAYFAHENTGISRAKSNDIAHLQPWDKPILTAAMFAVQGRDTLITLVDFLQSISNPVKSGGKIGPMHVDGAYNEFRNLYPKSLTLVATPLLAWQRPSASDISPTAIETRLPLVKPLIGLARRLRHALDPNR